MRFTVDPWDPGYGTPSEVDPSGDSSAQVDPEVEVSAADWAPRAAPADAYLPRSVLFVDGVRRVDARLWIDDDAGGVVSGVCASYAAGVVACDGRATVVAAEVGRGAYSPHSGASDIATRFGTYRARVANDGTPESLALALQDDMARCERAVSEQARRSDGDDLLVLDGPLRGRHHLPRTIGYVKTHNVIYLPAELNQVVSELRAGWRTPVFCVGGRFPRWSWYLRLADVDASPWAAVVRCEAPGDVELGAVTRLADTSAALLPRFGSEPHKDARAPQNLYPIAGLERQLRHRMGDALLLYRVLASAARSA